MSEQLLKAPNNWCAFSAHIIVPFKPFIMLSSIVQRKIKCLQDSIFVPQICFAWFTIYVSQLPLCYHQKEPDLAILPTF